MTKLRAFLGGVCLTLTVALGSTTVYAQPFSAQIQAALRAFLRAAHTWTGTQTFTDIVVNGTCGGCGGGAPTDGTAFTTNLITTKVDPALVLNSTVAGDTDWSITDCDDGGGDDDDVLQINISTTPCLAQPFTQLISGATIREQRFYPNPASTTYWLGMRQNANESVILEVRGANSSQRNLILSNSTNDGESAIVIDVNATARWSWSATAATRGFYLPVADNAYDIGAPTLGVKSIYAATSFHLDNNATLRAGAVTVGNVGANSCGTSPATIAGNNTAGKVTVGATSGTVCRVTFSSAWTNAPSCVVTNETTANLVRATSTATTVDFTGVFVAADSLAYSCLGY